MNNNNFGRKDSEKAGRPRTPVCDADHRRHRKNLLYIRNENCCDEQRQVEVHQSH